MAVFAVFLFSQPSHGEMKSIGFDGAFHYKPDKGFAGIDTFEYRIIDQWGNVSDPILVTLTIGKKDKEKDKEKDEEKVINQNLIDQIDDLINDLSDLRNDVAAMSLMVS